MVAASMIRKALPSVLRLCFNITGQLAGSAGDTALSILPVVATRKQAAVASRTPDAKQHQPFTFETSSLASVASYCIRVTMTCVSTLLSDAAPIPQYTLKMLMDVLTIGNDEGLANHLRDGDHDAANTTLATVGVAPGVAVVLDTVVQQMSSSGSLAAIISIWKRTNSEAISETNAEALTGHRGGDRVAGWGAAETTVAYAQHDSQQFVNVLRALCDCPNGIPLMIESDVCAALSIALSAVVSVRGTTDVLLSQNEVEENTTPLIELLHIVLHFIIRELARAESGLADAQSKKEHGANHDRNANGTSNITSDAELIATMQRKLSLAEHTRDRCAPLRTSASSMLILMQRCIDSMSAIAAAARRLSSDNEVAMQQARDVFRAHAHVMDVLSRCLGILFDLFPDSVALQLVSKQGLSVISSDGASTITARLLVARMLEESHEVTFCNVLMIFYNIFLVYGKHQIVRRAIMLVSYYSSYSLFITQYFMPPSMSITD